MPSEPSRKAIEAAHEHIDYKWGYPDAEECKAQTRSALVAAYAIDFADLRAELQAAQAERKNIIEVLGCHPAHILDEISQLTERAEGQPNADQYRQLGAQLATAQAEIEQLGSLRGNVLLQRDVERLEREIERLKASSEKRSPTET